MNMRNMEYTWTCLILIYLLLDNFIYIILIILFYINFFIIFFTNLIFLIWFFINLLNFFNISDNLNTSFLLRFVFILLFDLLSPLLLFFLLYLLIWYLFNLRIKKFLIYFLYLFYIIAIWFIFDYFIDIFKAINLLNKCIGYMLRLVKGWWFYLGQQYRDNFISI